MAYLDYPDNTQPMEPTAHSQQGIEMAVPSHPDRLRSWSAVSLADKCRPEMV